MPTPPTNVANIMSIHSTSVANILPTPNQPQKNGQEIGTGFSHLEWSSSVPFNVAEEPDDVQGKGCLKFIYSEKATKILLNLHLF